MNLTSLARPLIEIGRRLHAAGVLAGGEGDLSRRYPDGTRTDDGELVREGAWIITARGANTGLLAPADFTLLSHGDESLAGPEPSCEWRLHRAIYQMRPDAHAIVHAHPPYAIALALAGLALPADILPDLALDLGGIPLLPDAPPGSGVLVEAAQARLGRANAALLAGRGALTVGASPEQAAARMECLERAAQSHVLARLLQAGARD